MQPTMLWALLILVCLAPVVQGDCSSFIQDIQQCYSDQNLTLTVPPGQDAQLLLQNAMSLDASQVCRNLEAQKAATSCALGVARKCLDQLENGGLIPDPLKVHQGMDYLCDRKDDLDTECISSKDFTLKKCCTETFDRVLLEKGANLTAEEICCLVYDVTYDCSQKHLKSCMKDTLEICSKLQNEYNLPTACGSKPPGRPRKSYIDSSSPVSSAGPLGGLVALVALHLHLILLP